MVVDSCLSENKTPISLDYLRALGVDVANKVRLIVVTHWHDDHIGGISQLLKVATSANFACSAAIKTPEFFTLVAGAEKVKLVEHTTGISEFAEVLSILSDRESGRFGTGPDFWATDGMCLYKGKSPQRTSVLVLSPSAQTMTASLGQIAKLIPSAPEAIRRFPCLSPNDVSVVLMVQTTNVHLLLGADLENVSDKKRGWQGVVCSQSRPDQKCSGFKVAHHGSENADCEEIWAHLVVENGRALLTSFAGGRKPLPAQSDVERIKKRTKYAYCTMWPPVKKPPRRNVDRTMQEVARNRRALANRPGHIRLRSPFDGTLEQVVVDCFDGAKRL